MKIRKKEKQIKCGNVNNILIRNELIFQVGNRFNKENNNIYRPRTGL